MNKEINCTVPGCKNKATNPHNPVCESCTADGWTADFEEMSALIADDPLLAGKVHIVSPIQIEPPSDQNV